MDFIPGIYFKAMPFLNKKKNETQEAEVIEMIIDDKIIESQENHDQQCS